MIIDEMNSQAAVAYFPSVPLEKQTDTAEAHAESATRQQRATDKVDLSGYVPVTAEVPQRESRIQELKAQIASGTYDVPGRAVAEKMLSKAVM